MKVSDLMTRAVVTVSPGNSIRHAAQIMLENRVSGLPVVDGLGKIVGMITEGDLLRRIGDGLPGWSIAYQLRSSPNGAARDFVRTHGWSVGDAMTAPAVTVAEGATISRAARLLEARGIKRLPVVRDGRLVGVISRADLLHCLVDAPPETTASGDDAIRIAITARLRDAAGAIMDPPTVTVREGVVQIWGTLRSPAERAAVQVVIDGVPGVSGSVDHTFLAPSGPSITAATTQQT